MTTSREPTGSLALLERDAELATLDRLVEAALAGDAALAFVEGPPGVGKSRLLAAARETAGGAGMRVLHARGSDLERDLPFGVVRQLFDAALTDPDARDRWLTGSAEPAARVFGPLGADAVPGDLSLGLLVGLYWLTTNMAAETPLLLAIDDLHWCDPASLRFIAYLERRLEGTRVLVATTTRPGEPGAETRLIGEIAHDPAAVLLRPAPLTEPATAELVAERLAADPDPAFVSACHRASAGNPLLLGQLLATLAGQGVAPDAAHVDAIGEIGPRAVAGSVRLRLDRLAPDAHAVAGAVAVLGDDAGLPATAALAGIDEDRVAEAVRALVGAEILRPRAPLAFVHALVRDAVHLELTPAERELEHERAARVLLALEAPPDAVAAHLLATPARAEAWVVSLLREAAAAATRRGVPESAAAYLARALREPPPADVRADVLFALGQAEALLNRPVAVEYLTEAHVLLDDPQERLEAGRLLGRMLLFTRPPDEAVGVIAETIAELPADAGGERRALEALALWAGVAFGAETPGAATERLAAVRADRPADDVGGRMLQAVAAWDWALRGGTAEESTRLALAALDDGSLIEADPGFMGAVAGLPLVLADHPEAPAVWERALTQARRLGSTFAVCAVDQFRGWTWLQRGELGEAEGALRAAREVTMLVEGQGTEGLAYVTAFLGRVLVETGRVAEARALLAELGPVTAGSDGDALVRRAHLECLLADGAWTDALAAAEGYRDALRDVDNPAWGPWRSLAALARDALGQTDAALALLEDELAVARRWGAPAALSRTLRLLGRARRGDGLELLEEAVGVAEGSPARLEHAKALAALGSALRRERRPADAREPLRRAVEIADRCGAAPVAEHARVELRAAGGRARPSALSGPGALTPSEERVARLAADGLSNRDIAQTLYVTPKTVEVHLTSSYRKLGISARRELARALGEPPA